MASLNRVDLIGNLGSDPESRSMNNGGQVVSFRLACSETWKDRGGTRKEKTEWVPVVIFNDGIGKLASQYLRKGSKVFVSGKLQTRKWTDNNGTERYTTEVVVQQFGGQLVLLDSKREPDGSQGHTGQTADQGFGNDLDDDVPFLRWAD